MCTIRICIFMMHYMLACFSVIKDCKIIFCFSRIQASLPLLLPQLPVHLLLPLRQPQLKKRRRKNPNRKMTIWASVSLTRKCHCAFTLDIVVDNWFAYSVVGSDCQINDETFLLCLLLLIIPFCCQKINTCISFAQSDSSGKF